MLYKLDSVLLPPSTLSLARAPMGSGNSSEELRTSLTVMETLRARQVTGQWPSHS
jgi:hypothetical protein